MSKLNIAQKKFKELFSDKKSDFLILDYRFSDKAKYYNGFENDKGIHKSDTKTMNCSN